MGEGWRTMLLFSRYAAVPRGLRGCAAHSEDNELPLDDADFEFARTGPDLMPGANLLTAKIGGSCRRCGLARSACVD